jgi:hypothetical protein
MNNTTSTANQCDYMITGITEIINKISSFYVVCRLEIIAAVPFLCCCDSFLSCLMVAAGLSLRCCASFLSFIRIVVVLRLLENALLEL